MSNILWQQRGLSCDPAKVNHLKNLHGLSDLAARLLVAREIPENDIPILLNGTLKDLPDPFQLKDMDAAVKRLTAAIHGKETIAVHGDYDADGLTATALLVDGLRALGATVIYHIPHSLNDGYGLSQSGLEQSINQGAKVILSVDCGISETKKAAYLAQQGVELIITDHHQPPHQLPQAVSIVNPHQPGCRFPFKKLAGVGVAYFLLRGLIKNFQKNHPMINDPEWGLDLVAIGTIGDIVPLQGVNRILVKEGLRRIGGNPGNGVKTLLSNCYLPSFNPESIAFNVVPLLNAPNRLGECSKQIIDLFLQEDETEGQNIADNLKTINGRRLAKINETIKKLPPGFSGNFFFHASEEFLPGLVGTVASRKVEKTGVPVLLVAKKSQGVCKVSGRARNFDLHRFFQANIDILEGAGGHPNAAGAGILEQNIDELQNRLKAALGNQNFAPPSKFYDGEVSLGQMTDCEAKSLALLAPFGAEFEEPCFILRSLAFDNLRKVKGGHLKFLAIDNQTEIPCIWKRKGKNLENVEGCSLVDLLAVPEYSDQYGLSLKIHDIRPA